MRICIGGKNNIAVAVCSYILEIYPAIGLYVIPNKSDDGKNGFQRSLRKFAEEHDVPVVTLSDVYPWDDLIFLSLEFDRIIRPEKFNSKELFNIHFSLLPKYKGCHTAAMPILNGDEIGGVTFHLMEQGMDTGDVIDQEKILIDKDETCRSLYFKYLELGAKVVVRNLDAVISKSYQATPQSCEGSTYYARTVIDYSDLQIDFNCTAQQIERQIRAYSFRDFQLPKYNGEPIFYAEITASKSSERPGTIVSETVESYTIATIDYDITLYKDRLDELMEMVKNGDLDALKAVKNLRRYTKEQEPAHGWTLLMVAAYYNHYDVADCLIHQGSNINAWNYKGTTVIMYAKNGMLQTGDDRLFKHLLDKGANPFIKDFSGKNLFDYIDKTVKYQMIMNIPFNECQKVNLDVLGGVNSKFSVRSLEFRAGCIAALEERRAAA